MPTTLIVPGLHSSGPAHWQSWFEERIPGSLRVIQADWTDAELSSWSARVRRDISRTPGRLFIAAHSFGVLAAVQAAFDHSERIAGALLVAPADPDKFGVSDHLPLVTLPFPTVVVGSTNDPWMTLERAAHWADLWGADFVNLGAAGHINAEAGFGPWPEGLALLERLRRSAQTISRAVARDTAGGHLRHAEARRRLRTVHPSPQGFAGDGIAVARAARVLQRAGWQVSPPAGAAFVTRL